jgi:ABC-type polysaccharide/polyol phosphate transport system ATPase subunit
VSDTAIHVQNLGKLYKIGQWEPYPTLRAAITNYFTGASQRLAATLTSTVIKPKRFMSNGSSMSEVNSPGINFQAPAANNDYALATQHSDHIWALKGACFEVKKGEVVGIIGPNGSGKSTLLKLLSQITDPSEGEILIDGRVTALIELGAAFHPELTGRENIYLNGAILGLTKKEVDARFKQIVDFAEVWDFIDTPVKRYASGMTVRLGFAVAVSVDPEILLVDEGLAVGDAAFRTRCFERIDAFIRAGKTLIIVTHSLEEISRLASRGILIDRGVIKADGLPDDVIAHYTRLIAEKAVSTQPALAKRQGKDATDRG